MLVAVGQGVATALSVVAIATSALVTALMVFLVVARYLLGLSVVGLHELILLFAIQLYMVGALIASQRGTHLTVDWLSQRFHEGRAASWHKLLVAGLTLIVTLFFVVWAYWMLSWGLKRPQTTPALGIPLVWSQAAIMVGALGCSAFALRDLLRAALSLRRPA
ncbi:MAG: TRAP transporter small permease [Rhodospirillales bacterium]